MIQLDKDGVVIQGNTQEMITQKHFFEHLAYQLAQIDTWTKNPPVPSIIESQIHSLRIQAQTLVSLMCGTSYYPVGTSLVEYFGIMMPKPWTDYLRTQTEWPKWYDRPRA